MIGVTAHAKTDQLGIDLGTTGLGVFVLFQHQYAGTVTQHEAVAILSQGRLALVGSSLRVEAPWQQQNPCPWE